MARKPDLPSREVDVLSLADLKEMREGLSRLSIEAVRHAYQTAYARCRMVNDRVPSARSMQELVQTWKQLWMWRR
jgi:acyl-[acyl carrier protein]--UDP-N-acetylglucosamine O-acyltransferase